MEKVHTLLTPLTFGKKEITELRFREYTLASDYLAFDVRGGAAQRQALIANLTSLDISVIEKLRGPDYQIACRIADAMIDADEVAAAAVGESKEEGKVKPGEE